MDPLHHSIIETPFRPVNIVSFPSFGGNESEDVNQFLRDFSRAATFYELSDEKQALVLPFYLKGNASIWFKSLSSLRNETNLQELKEALLKQYVPSYYYLRLRTQLDEIKQCKDQRVDDYIAEVRQCCSRLNLIQSEWMHHLLKGLRSEIKEYVLLQAPETFEEAEKYARLKEFALQTITRERKCSHTVDTESQKANLEQQVLEQVKMEFRLFHSPRSAVALSRLGTVMVQWRKGFWVQESWTHDALRNEKQGSQRRSQHG